MTSNILTAEIQNTYGAFELKRVYPRNVALSVILAIFIHLFLIGSYLFFNSLSKDAVLTPPVFTIWTDGGQTTIFPVDIPTPKTIIGANSTNLTQGIPVATKGEVTEKSTMPTQTDLNNFLNGQNNSGGIPPTAVVKPVDSEPAGKEEEIPPYFKAVEEQPKPISLVTPVYPEIAIKAGLSGIVYLRILVNKEGRPLKTEVLKTNNEIFIEPAKDAAMKSLFSPAIQNGKAVSCWVNIPFKFSIHNN